MSYGLGSGLLALALLASHATPADGQQNVVAGQIVDAATGQPVAAAQIAVENTGRGTITDDNGRFRIENLEGTSVTLRVVMLGYRTATQAVPVGSTNVRIELRNVPLELDEVVVTGTVGETQRRELGNAVSRFDVAAKLEDVQTTNIRDLLQGSASGVNVLRSAGVAGGGQRIIIRGLSSFTLSHEPLIYIDGVRVNNQTVTGNIHGGGVSRLGDLDPESIESIEIIKGPAAATLYGTEANNGVIQIITKKGQQGPLRFHFRAKQGANWFNNIDDRWPTNYWRNPQTGEIETLNSLVNEKEHGDQIFRTGWVRGYSLDVSGGSDLARLTAGASWDQEEGAAVQNEDKSFAGRIGVSFTPNDNLAVNANTQVALKRLALPQQPTIIRFGFAANPRDVDTPQRGWISAPNDAWRERLQIHQDVNRVTTSVTVRNTPTNWFNHQLVAGFDYADVQDNLLQRFLPEGSYAYQFFPGDQAKGSVFLDNSRTLYTTLTYGAGATTTLTENLESTTSAGLQYYRKFIETTSLDGMEFPAPGVTTVSGTARTTAGSDYLENVTVGGYVQQQFGWSDRLFLTAAIRGDDNSAFGQNFDFVTYPKVSAAWVISEEPFWSIPAVSSLKLRGAYGLTGQQPDAFAAVRLFRPVPGHGGAAAITPEAIGNPDLGPEKGREIEVGFEASLFDQRYGLDFTYYNQRTTDAILQRQVPPSTGFATTQYVNAGEIQNKGIEVQVNGLLLDRDDFDWDFSFNYSLNKNKILSMPGVDFLRLGWGLARHVEGYPLATNFAKRVVAAEWGPDGTPINVLCDAGDQPPMPCDQAPVVAMGQNNPQYNGGLTTGLTFFDRLRLTSTLTFMGGNDKFSDSWTWLRCVAYKVCEVNANPQKFDPKLVAEVELGQTEDYQFEIQDGSFIRWHELSMGYTVPDTWASRLGASRLRIMLTGRNLHFWTSFDGLDPEATAVTYASSTLGTNYDAINSDINQLPLMTQFLFSLDVTF